MADSGIDKHCRACRLIALMTDRSHAGSKHPKSCYNGLLHWQKNWWWWSICRDNQLSLHRQSSTFRTTITKVQLQYYQDNRNAWLHKKTKWRLATLQSLFGSTLKRWMTIEPLLMFSQSAMLDWPFRGQPAEQAATSFRAVVVDVTFTFCLIFGARKESCLMPSLRQWN